MAHPLPPDEFDTLEYEVATGDLQIVHERVERLLGRGRTISKFSGLLGVAITYNRTAVLQYLLEQDVELSSEAAIAAVKRKNYTAMELLLSHGWDINKALSSTQPPVLSVGLDDMAMTTWLLGKGADPNASCDVECTCLSIAVQTAEHEVIDLLLKSGGDVRRGNLIHYALWRRPIDLDLVYSLAQYGAPCDDVVFQDEKSFQLRGHFLLGTPLHEVCQGNVVVTSSRDVATVASILLAHGANPDKRKLQHGRSAGATAREIAGQRGDYNMLQLFEIPIELLTRRVFTSS
ncbi:hypothetical protein CBER1_10991 [Cercospora berteroae]|uniref:Uncharacterized protein n=1 Tax=Cercospora berteroae TaxID=357750 RepID=A0A2S6BXD0_9PEZI|nr:hypothetical protein CBER1_10991 [Cercospora berteroae]